MINETVPQAEVDAWVQAIAAVATLWSGFGYTDAPLEIVEMFTRAIEIGYMSALRYVREGSYDAEIAAWRPDLSGT